MPDHLRLDDTQLPAFNSKAPSFNAKNLNHHIHKGSFKTLNGAQRNRYQTKNAKIAQNGDAPTSNATTTTTKNPKKAKRLPWNTKVLVDRFTPQTYLVQLIDFCLNNLCNKNNDPRIEHHNNVLVFLRNEEYKNYLKIIIIKQFSLSSNNSNSSKLILLVTNMGSDVSKYVEIISRHTTLKLAGIDLNLRKSQADLSKLKREANILIMSVQVLLEWFKAEYLSLDEIELIIFDEVSAAFHNNSYATFMDMIKNTNTNNKLDNQRRPLLPKIFGLGSLEIDRATTHVQVELHIEHLKKLFQCSQIETATDLLDTQNLLYGFEPKECVQICENASLSDTDSNKFQLKLIERIKQCYIFLEHVHHSLDTGTTAALNIFN
jgi:hypothetical protein